MTLRAVALCCALAPGLALAVSEDEARAAHDKKDYPACAEAYGQLASTSAVDDQPTHLQHRAGCLALGGKVDDALTVVEQSAALDAEVTEAMKQDADLVSLRALPRWLTVMKQADAQLSAARKTQNVALAKELITMADRDHSARQGLGKQGLLDITSAAFEVEKQNTRRLKQVLAKYGWPGRKLVGKRGARAAWLLAQHSGNDLPFLEKCLALMQAAKDDVSPMGVAYLEDLVRVMQGKPQRYGTIFGPGDDEFELMPIDDVEHVDERRRAMGLGPLAQQPRPTSSNFMLGP